jgi:3-hydroxymyristoyl/3-hydroxydecanoyl-(acyl carrier protein) dehydratase
MTRALPIRDVTVRDQVWDGTALVPDDLIYFEGHFVDHPVLPAVAQLDALVVTAIREAWPSLGRLERLTRLKFRRVVPPGARLRLHLERSADPAGASSMETEQRTTVRFEIELDDQLCSSGSLHFGTP